MISNRAYSAVTIRNERILDKSFAKIAPSIEVKKEDVKLILNAESILRKEKADNFEAINENLNMKSVTYALYVYRREIKRRRLHITRLSQAKLDLTNDLIVKSAGDIHTGLTNGINSNNFKNDMSALTREVMYMKKLHDRMKRTAECLKNKKDRAKEVRDEKKSSAGDKVQNNCAKEVQDEKKSSAAQRQGIIKIQNGRSSVGDNVQSQEIIQKQNGKKSSAGNNVQEQEIIKIQNKKNVMSMKKLQARMKRTAKCLKNKKHHVRKGVREVQDGKRPAGDNV